MNKINTLSLIQDYLTKYPEDTHGKETLDFVNSTDNFWRRDNETGHITASIWVLNKNKKRALMTHHAALDIWVQLGGHIESEDNSIIEACIRELKEESGLTSFSILDSEIFDIDVHTIPLNAKGIKAHKHYDIRYLVFADDCLPLTYSTEESKQVSWLDFDSIRTKTQSTSVLRMIEKIERFDG